MSQLLTWSEVDSNIQTEMGNQAPSESNRLEAINNTARELKTDYDVTVSRRTVEIYVIPDGTLYIVADIVDSSAATVLTDDDIKKVDSLTSSDDSGTREYEWMEKNKFFRNINSGVSEDAHTTFFKNGKMYFAMNSQDSETVATTFDMDYFSTFLGLNASGTFIEEITAVSTTKILLPDRFKGIMVSGSIKKLLYQSIGDDGNTQYSLNANKFKSEVKKLGLDSVTKPLKRETRKVKINNPLA